MATETFKATVSTDFQGNKIPEIPFTYDALQYANYADVPEKDKLKEKDMLKVVNAAEKAAARAKETAQVLINAGYKRPERDSVEFLTNEMVKLQMKLNKNLTEDEARKIVEQAQAASQAVSA